MVKNVNRPLRPMQSCIALAKKQLGIPCEVTDATAYQLAEPDEDPGTQHPREKHYRRSRKQLQEQPCFGP
jgi:hypothetical protein